MYRILITSEFCLEFVGWQAEIMDSSSAGRIRYIRAEVESVERNGDDMFVFMLGLSVEQELREDNPFNLSPQGWIRSGRLAYIVKSFWNTFLIKAQPREVCIRTLDDGGSQIVFHHPTDPTNLNLRKILGLKEEVKEDTPAETSAA